MKPSRPWLLLCFSLLIFGCRNQDESRIHQVWNYIRERPDSALTVLNEYDLADLHSRRAQAEYALLKSIALDKNFIDLQVDTLIRPALEYYEKWGNNREKMLSWYYLGRVQVNAKEYNDAIISISRADDYASYCDDPYQDALIHMAKENIYNNTHNHSEALEEAMAGVRIFENLGEIALALKATRHLANDYLVMRDFAHADSLYKIIIDNPASDSSLVAKCLLHYARSLALQAEYSKALQYYVKGIKEYHGTMNIQQAGMYAVSHFYSGDPNIGRSIKNTLDHKQSSRGMYLWVAYKESLLAEHHAEALSFYQELTALEDSVAVNTMEQSIIKSQRDYRQKSSEVFQLQSERQRYIILAIITVFLLIGLLTFLVFRQFMIKQRLKEERMIASHEEIKQLFKETDEQNHVLKSELTLARKQYVSAFKKQFSKIARLSEIYFRTSDSRDAREKVYREVRELSSFITKDTRTYRQLEKNVNNGLSNAMKLFREEYPDLEEKTYRFVCYLMAGLPASTISLLTGWSNNNIYVRKNRLLDSIRSNITKHRDLFILAIE